MKNLFSLVAFSLVLGSFSSLEARGRELSSKGLSSEAKAYLQEFVKRAYFQGPSYLCCMDAGGVVTLLEDGSNACDFTQGGAQVFDECLDGKNIPESFY